MCLRREEGTLPTRAESLGENAIALSAFDKEPDWAQFAGEATEKKLRPLRKQLKLIANISRQLAVLKKLRQQGGKQ